jgi:hypothetical protein
MKELAAGKLHLALPFVSLLDHLVGKREQSWRKVKA